MRSKLRAWWHYQLWGWVGQHAPAGLRFQCVLEAYSDLCSEKTLTNCIDMTGEQLLNFSGRQVEEALARPVRFPKLRRQILRPVIIGVLIGAPIGIVLGLAWAGRLW